MALPASIAVGIAPSSADFARVADMIAERAADLLRTRISVADERGVVVASSDPHLVGRPAAGVAPPGELRVPLQLDAQAGEVLIAAAPTGEDTIPPRLAHALVDLVVNQVAVVDRLPHQPELRNKFVYDLLHGAAGDRAALLRDARLLGLDLSPPRAVLLIDAADFVRGGSGSPADVSPAERRRRAQLVVASVVGFFNLPDDTICAAGGDGEVAVLKASDSKNLEDWVDHEDDREPPGASWANLAALKRAGRALLARLRHDIGATVTIGIGRYHPGVRGLARSYEDARAALSLGRRLHGANHVHCLDGLGIAAFVGVADERTKIGLATHLLSPLDDDAALLATLDAFFGEDCCPSAAAARLGIHRNTLGYRLDKVASMTGLDPRRFDDAVRIRLALVLRSLGDASG
ncbi:MAG: helix-turn-helix domain-containing protein [Chloroflexota bacterium]|nr:helix-turn-helix domain-containing protein [Chloroflexota bacterium]